MSSPLPARRGPRGGARPTEGPRSATATERGDDPAGPMGREVEQAAGAGPRVSASELGGRRAPARTARHGADTSTPGPPSGGGEPSGGGRAERTRAALRSPAALRQAILIREILGPPAAFQTGHRDVPGLPGH